jgi:predicted nucleotidyltransferase
MLTAKQMHIFEAFLSKPYQEFTYKEIKDYSKEKSNSIIQRSIVKFLAEELVKKRKVGNVILYMVNLENSAVFAYFDILIKKKLSNLVHNSLSIIKEELTHFSFSSLVVFGSYAQGKQTKKSDLDIAILVASVEDKKNCELAMKSAELKSILKLDVHVLTKDELLYMLKDKHENLGKQIAYKHLAIQNPMIFYSVLEEGISNGFKIIYS